MEILPLTEETMGLEMDLCLRFHPSVYTVPEANAGEGRRTLRARGSSGGSSSG
jgi:hypothetical protein